MTAIARARRRLGVATASRPSVISWLVTGLVLVVMLATTWVRRGSVEFPGPTLVIFAIVAWSPLLLRIHRPLLALGGTALFETLHLIIVPIATPDTMDAGIRMGAYQPVPIATMIAAFTVASRAPRLLGWVAGVGAAAVLLLVSVLVSPLVLLATDLVMFNLVVIATAAGVAVGARADRIRREADDREASTRQAVLDERLRIARELHDVLAHNLTLLNAQASVAEYLLATDPAAAAAALRGMSVHSGRAIDELRSAVGLLRRDTPGAETSNLGPDPTRSPIPGLDQIRDLVEAVRTAGTPVDLRISGSGVPLSELGDAAVYRIVQEALTNATKHAPGSPVTVELTWSDSDLDLAIRNPIQTRTRTSAPGTGHGLIGMRERADAAGGHLDIANVTGETFVVHAVLPTERDTSGLSGPRKGART